MIPSPLDALQWACSGLFWLSLTALGQCALLAYRLRWWGRRFSAEERALRRLGREVRRAERFVDRATAAKTRHRRCIYRALRRVDRTFGRPPQLSGSGVPIMPDARRAAS